MSLNVSKQKKYELIDSFDGQTIQIKAETYDKYKEESKKRWATLPDSVIGTLLYFLKIEQNTPNFDVFSTLKAIILIGFPTYVTYCVQFLFVYGLYMSTFTPVENDDGVMENKIADSICGIIYTFPLIIFPFIYQITILFS